MLRQLPGLRSILFLGKANQELVQAQPYSISHLRLSFEPILMELVELSTTSLAEATFEKLELPRPVYHVRQLEQGGYKSQVEFHPTKERFHASAQRVRLPSAICASREASMNCAADRAIEYMETRESKVLVDYNYYQLQHQKKAHARASGRLLEKAEEINQHSQTIKQMTKEASNYLEEVHTASSKVHGLAAVALDPAASVSLSNMKQVVLEIQNAVIALQNTTAAARVSLEEKGMYSDDDVDEPVYNDLSGASTDEDYHRDMDPNYNNYVRSP